MELVLRRLQSRVLWGAAGVVLAALAVSGCAFSPEAREARFLDAGKKALAKKDYGRAIIQFTNAVRVKKDDAEAYYQLALAHLAMGDYPAALPLLDKTLQFNAKHVQAQIRMAEILGSTSTEKYIQDAEKRARHVLESAPADADALNALAVAEWKLGQQRNAESDFLRALGQAPQNLRASLNLAKLKVEEKDVQGAEEVIKKSVAANPKAPAPIVALGVLYAEDGKADAAEQQYRLALQLEPNNDLALLCLADLYVRTNRTDLAEQTYKLVSALPDRRYKPTHAIFLFRSGKLDQAIAEFEKLAAADPSDRAARTRLVEAYLAANKSADAERVLAEALHKNNKDLDALLQRSRIYLKMGNYAAAQQDAAQVLRFQADSATAHYIMSRLQKAKGAPLLQRQELTDAVRLNRYLLPARLELAELLLEANAAKTALEVLDETPPVQKHTLQVLVQRNWTLWILEDLPELSKGVEEGLRLARTPDLLVQDGLLKLRQGKLGEGRTAIEEALKINPGDLRALSALSGSYLAQKQGAVAVQRVQEYAAQQPKSAAVQNLLGNVLLANGKKEEARTVFGDAIGANPRFIPALLSLAQMDAADHKWDAAEQRLKTVLAIDGANQTARQWLGDIMMLKGNHGDALQYYRQLADVDAGNASVLNNMAYLMAERGQSDEALRYAEKAQELAPENPTYADTLGWVLYQKGLYPLAVKQLKRAASEGDNVVWKYHLAMACARAGDKKQARAVLAAALKQDPSVPEANVAKGLLDQND